MLGNLTKAQMLGNLTKAQMLGIVTRAFSHVHPCMQVL
jgi:hypothetical protein